MSSKASKGDLSFGLSRERRAAELFVNLKWPGATLAGAATFSHIDFVVIREEKIIAFLEVKARRCPSTAFVTTAVAFTKHEAAQALQKFMSAPTFCLVVFTDQMGSFLLTRRPAGKEFIGRVDRGGVGTEHALYPVADMTFHDGLAQELEEQLGAE
jgi:hypothetical protein